MFYQNGRLLFCLTLLGFLAFGLACSDENIPQSPAAPFSSTKIGITNVTSPKPGTPLTAGTTVNFTVGYAYNLTPGDDRIRANLALFLDFYGLDANNNVIQIGAFPNKQLPLNATSALQTESLPIQIPAGTRSVILEAFVDTLAFRNPVIQLDQRSWPVQ